MAPMHHPQVVLVTDQGFLRPTLVTLWGLLRHLSVPATVHFWGDQLTDNDWEKVRRVVLTNPLATLKCLNLSDEDVGGEIKQDTRLTAAALGRLRIAEKLSGRVLYLDGDTHIKGDITPLFSTELNGCLIGAVRDYVIAKWSRRNLKVSEKYAHRIATLQDLLGQKDLSKYFNSGVLLIDTDAIRQETSVYDAMRDIASAKIQSLADQDHLNKVFNGRTLMLIPAYNASWSRTSRQRRNSHALGADKDECTSLPDCIVHFHGTPKPWTGARKDLWKARGRAVWRYRRDLEIFRRLFPDIEI